MDLVTPTGVVVPWQPDPTALHVRELGRQDRDVVLEVFEGLSPRSRHLRFLSPVPVLRGAMLRQLSDLDGHRHVALVAERRETGRARPVGIARYYRLGPDRAEIALEIVDAWQARGVGRLLLRSLADHARARGVETLVAEALGDNRVVLGLVRAVLADVRTSVGDGLVHVVASSAPRDAVAACA